jgi:hypothetical protein
MELCSEASHRAQLRGNRRRLLHRIIRAENPRRSVVRTAKAGMERLPALRPKSPVYALLWLSSIMPVSRGRSGRCTAGGDAHLGATLSGMIINFLFPRHLSVFFLSTRVIHDSAIPLSMVLFYKMCSNTISLLRPVYTISGTGHRAARQP